MEPRTEDNTHSSRRKTPAAISAEQVTDLREEISQLRQALRSRASIEQGKGMLMLRYGLSADQAFTMLARWSQNENIKLHSLSAALVEVGIEEARARKEHEPPSMRRFVLDAVRRARSPSDKRTTAPATPPDADRPSERAPRDRPARAELYDRHGSGMFCLAYLSTSDPDAAADAVVAAFEGAETVTTYADPKRIARALARRTFLACPLYPPVRDPGTGPNGAPRPDELSHMSQRARQLIGLTLFGSHSYRQAAALLRLDPQTAASVLTELLRDTAHREGCLEVGVNHAPNGGGPAHAFSRNGFGDSTTTRDPGWQQGFI